MSVIDIFNSAVAVVSQLPLEKIFIRRPYIEETRIIDNNISQEISGLENVVTTDSLYEASLGVHDDETPQSEYAGTSQISAAGKACIPCGNDHFSTVSGDLSEAKRFALDNKTLDHPEIIMRIAHAEDELNSFERIDGAPGKVVKLPPEEKEMMDEMLIASREVRHALKELNKGSSLGDLEKVGALAEEKRNHFRTRLFRMQMARLTPEQRSEVEEKAKGMIERGLSEVGS